MADIVVYGGELGGCAAALTAARHAPAGSEVVLCFPEPVPGGIATTGALTWWERRLWTHGGRRADPQGGHFARWLSALGPVYRSAALARLLTASLNEAQVRILAGYEVEAVQPRRPAGAKGKGSRRARKGPPVGIETIHVRRLQPPHGGQPPAFAAEPGEQLRAQVFIDASATARLARLAGVPLSPGRADWDPDGRQMAASLLFAVEGVDWDTVVGARDEADRPVYGTAVEVGADDGRPRRVFWGGRQVTGDPVFADFAQLHPGMRLAPLRAWEEEEGLFWVQSLLLFGVDGCRRSYDAEPWDGPAAPPDALDQDTAWQKARSLIASSDLLGCLRRFPGLQAVRIARGSDGLPRVGSVLFLRETCHARSSGPDPFAVTVEDVTGAGTGPQEGVDQRHYRRRIGLGFYWMENVGYTPDASQPPTAAAANPVYLPLDALLCPPVDNLLLAGYGMRMESRAWWAMRTQPNLAVLGDGAGVAAAYALREGKSVLQFGNHELAALQARLLDEGAILEKW